MSIKQMKLSNAGGDRFVRIVSSKNPRCSLIPASLRSQLICRVVGQTRRTSCF